jgi:hypothetical protein
VTATTDAGATRDRLHRLLADGNGILRCEPAWVARDFLPAGRRLGLPEAAYDVGGRGAICERWLASTTRADNRVGPDDEGLSRLASDGVGEGDEPLLLRDAVSADPAAVMGASYAASHPAGLGRLAKIFDYAHRLPYHVHPPQEFASLVGCSAKDESYHFLDGADLGAHPETFFGVHPWIAEQRAHETLLPYLVDWDSDLILRHARAELQVVGEGFHVPSGVLHAPGTALTLELQEDSDVLAMFQALNAGRIISKELLFKDVRPEDREREGERFPLRFVDWETNGDPWLYEHRHLSPQPVAGAAGEGEEAWVFYNTRKYAGKRLRLAPGRTHTLREPGVHSVFVWSGAGTWAGHDVRGGEPGRDELVVTHEAAVRDHEVVNTGTEELVAFLFFGPDLHDVPLIPRRSA